MKSAEKLKRIKLISEKLFVEVTSLCLTDDGIVSLNKDDCETISKVSIEMSKIFVDRFEKFEDEFLNENAVNCPRPEPISSTEVENDAKV